MLVRPVLATHCAPSHKKMLLLLTAFYAATIAGRCVAEPHFPVWPEQFHAVLFQNRTGNLALLDLWYDWPNGRNFNIIHKQLGPTIFDLELNNGTQHFWSDNKEDCKTIHQPVGILPPDWLRNATYLGESKLGSFDVNGWTKAPWPTKDRPFVHYYADVQTGQPVYWEFFTGAQFHILSFEVNATLPEEQWQVPAQCPVDPVFSIAQKPIDHAFSWTSLVHADA